MRQWQVELEHKNQRDQPKMNHTDSTDKIQTWIITNQKVNYHNSGEVAQLVTFHLPTTPVSAVKTAEVNLAWQQCRLTYATATKDLVYLQIPPRFDETNLDPPTQAHHQVATLLLQGAEMYNLKWWVKSK